MTLDLARHALDAADRATGTALEGAVRTWFALEPVVAGVWRSVRGTANAFADSD